MRLQQTVPLLLVSNIAQSNSFYCDRLGFESTRTWEPQGELNWCWLQHDDAALMLQQANEEDPPPTAWGKGMTLFFICDDVDALFSTVSERGAVATEPADAFYGMRQTFVTDPDGYQLCFEQPTADW